jgi:cation diffusion facilitator CzcD-associated flavoprotein CzcO
VREFHSSALRDPAMLAGRDVLVVGGGASAFDLLDLCFQYGARRVVWVYRGLRWFLPTRKPKHVAGSVRGFARMQASGMTAAQQSAAINADLRSRYEKFGIGEIMPEHDFNVQRDQLIPGRPGMLANFSAIERHADSVASISGRTVALSGGHSMEVDLLLWGTGYSVDLSYFEAQRSRRSARSMRWPHVAGASFEASMPPTCISRVSASTALAQPPGFIAC